MNQPQGPSRLGPFSLASVVLAALTGCGQQEASGKDHEGPSSLPVATDVLDLITALTPLPSTVGAGNQHEWFTRRRQMLARMRSAGPEVGAEALRMFAKREDAGSEVRGGLLDVAAHGVPEETRPLLVELVTTFGPDEGLRTKAAELLGKTAPQTGIEVIGPILRGEKTGRTYPPTDQLLEAWFEAAGTLEIDPVPMLCLLGMDLSRDQATRNFATKRLGEIQSVQGRQALEQILVESSGNHMIRRFAAQSLQTTIPAEEFCALMRRTLDREADMAFQKFLDQVLLAHCR